MFSLSQTESREQQEALSREAVEKISERLQSLDDTQIDIPKTIDWVSSVFENAIKISSDENLELEPPDPITLPREICAYTVQTIVRILTSRSILRDNSLYYLSDTSQSLGLGGAETKNLLNNAFKDLQHEFTDQMISELDDDQIYWCALILMKIICADGQIHPAEKTFFEVIEALLENSNETIQTLEKKALEKNHIPELTLNQNTAEIMMKYVITIAMCDGEYVGKESEFIKEAAKALGIEESKIDSILQPIAGSFMVMHSLFTT